MNEGTRHYLYFPTPERAQAVATALRDELEVTCEESAEGGEWLVLVEHEPASRDEFDSLRARLDRLATEYGGEYDGWEMAVH